MLCEIPPRPSANARSLLLCDIATLAYTFAQMGRRNNLRVRGFRKVLSTVWIGFKNLPFYARVLFSVFLFISFYRFSFVFSEFLFSPFHIFLFSNTCRLSLIHLEYFSYTGWNFFRFMLKKYSKTCHTFEHLLYTQWTFFKNTIKIFVKQAKKFLSVYKHFFQMAQTFFICYEHFTKIVHFFVWTFFKCHE